jgi:uncharacterized protein (DUF1778 family)
MKTLTVRMSDEDYQAIVKGAKRDKRTLSNFMLASTLKSVQKSYYVSAAEMQDIVSDKVSMKGIGEGHRDARNKRGRHV